MKLRSMSKNSNKQLSLKMIRGFVFQTAKLLFFICFLFLPVRAQEVPDIDNSAVVTATVPDLEPPNTPILIAPADESNLSIA